MDTAQIHEVAKRGTSSTGGPLPYLDVIQRSFGKHDVSGVAAHTDASAVAASRAIDAAAYTTGNHVAFAESPSLRTAAHEAAHAVQQRSGVQLLGGVGQVGDPHEQHADAVADLVVQGRSAEALLDTHAGGAAGPSVQRQPDGQPDGKTTPPEPKPVSKPPDAKPPAPKPPAPKPTNSDDTPLKWTWKDLAAYPLLVDIWHDVACKRLTPGDYKLLKLKGTEGAAFYAWTMAMGLAPGGLAGGTTPKDFGEYLKATYGYADALTGLTPASDAIFDPFSRLVGLRVDDYLASDLFISRIKAHTASVTALFLLAQGTYSLIQEVKERNTDPNALEGDVWTRQTGFVKALVGAIAKEHLKAPGFFDVGPLQLATHPAFSAQPFAGGSAPSGVTFERNEGVDRKVHEQKYGLTLNLPKFFKPGGAETKDIGDPAKYRNWQTSLWFNYDSNDPLTATPDKQAGYKFKGGTIFGYGGHLAELEAGAQYGGETGKALTSWFVRGGYGYTADQKDTGFLKKLGFTATFMDWKENYVLAPTDDGGAKAPGWSLKATPFIATSFKLADKHTLDASLALSFVGGKVGDKGTFGVSDVSGGLAYTYLGDSAPGKLPAFKLDLSASVGRLDWFDPNSPLLWGVKGKMNIGQFFTGAQVMTGAGGIPDARKDIMGPTVKLMVPTTLLFTGGVAF